jgi:iron-sulfur cluster repair protein YtfE (RIC family)
MNDFISLLQQMIPKLDAGTLIILIGVIVALYKRAKNEIKTELAILDSKIEGKHKDSDTKTTGLEAKLCNVEAKITAHLTNMETKLINMESRIDSRHTNLENKIDKMQDTITDIDRRLCRLEGAFASKDCCMIKDSSQMKKAE